MKAAIADLANLARPLRIARAARRCLIACVAGLPLSAALAAGYPDRPLHWVVPYPPGGTTDVIARDVAQAVSQALNIAIVIDNRGGAGGQIAMNWVAKAAPDGYTLLVSDASLATVPSLYDNLPFDPVKDFAPISQFVTVPNIVVVNPALPVHSLAELIALSKQRGGKIDFGSGGVGSPLHLAGEALRLATGIQWTHIPYKGAGPALIATITGEVQVSTPSLPAALPQVEAGQLRVLAVSEPARLDVLPNVPTVAELGYPKATAFGWVGLHAPAGTPPAVIAKLETAIAQAMHDPTLLKRLHDQGAQPALQPAAAYGQLIASETARWKAVVQAAGIPRQ